MKKGHFDSKTGGIGLFPKTESESWGLPLMNGGLKKKNGNSGSDSEKPDILSLIIMRCFGYLT